MAFYNRSSGLVQAYPEPNVYDGSKYRFVQDYCGSGTVTVSGGRPGEWCGTFPTYEEDEATGLHYGRSSGCWSGQRIPLCRSFNILRNTNC